MILLRHAQSEFNLHMTANRRDPGIVDPKLTPLGHRQAREAAARLQALGEPIRRIIVSPYTRALQTAAPIARALGAPVIVNPIMRERYGPDREVGTPRRASALSRIPNTRCCRLKRLSLCLCVIHDDNTPSA